MANHSAAIDAHYGFNGLLDRVLDGLARAGKDVHSLSVDDLAPIDEFHSRGRDSTLELIDLAEIKPSYDVLDVGCGLGGSARHIANEFQCRVVGVDLTQEYIDAAVRLTEMVGLADRVRFQQGCALELPFENESFDVVLTEHAQMNIADKEQFYSEIARVLRPGGRFLFHDIFQGPSDAPLFPVPWAEDALISFLAAEKTARRFIEQFGLSICQWEAKNTESIQFFHDVVQRINESGPPPIGIHILMGNNAGLKLQNYVRNLKDQRVAVAMGRANKTSSPLRHR